MSALKFDNWNISNVTGPKQRIQRKSITSKALKKAELNGFVQEGCINNVCSLLTVLLSVRREMEELKVYTPVRRMESLV